jgi:hypothetical protein
MKVFRGLLIAVPLGLAFWFLMGLIVLWVMR